MEPNAMSVHIEPARTTRPRSGQADENASDLFTLGRAACALRTKLFGQRGFFVRSRRLLPSGQWQGPRDAAMSWIDFDDLLALGGIAQATARGVHVIITDDAKKAARIAAEELAPPQTGVAIWWRARFRRDDTPETRELLFTSAKTLSALARSPNAIEAILPWPEDEPMGLDTLALFARLRTASTQLDVAAPSRGPHLVADFARLGHRLAQMCLTVGADGLFGPIVAERGLRLGDNANNPALTRREAATLLRGAGLVPHERVSAGASTFRFEEYAP